RRSKPADSRSTGQRRPASGPAFSCTLIRSVRLQPDGLSAPSAERLCVALRRAQGRPLTGKLAGTAGLRSVSFPPAAIKGLSGRLLLHVISAGGGHNATDRGEGDRRDGALRPAVSGIESGSA